jgi:hypothetical protein
MTAFRSLIESPIRPIRPFKRRRSFTELFNSPVKRSKVATRPDDLFTPVQRGGKAPSPDLIGPRPQALPIKKRRIRKRGQSKKAPKEGQAARASPLAVLDDDGGFEDWIAFDNYDDSSPGKAKDNIDWTISLEDVEKLKLELLPSYWERLSFNVNSIVRVTERLYIVQDWHKDGRLKV